MKFGIAFANTGPAVDPDAAAMLARAAEHAGFESIWTVEHVIWPTSYESVYPYHPSGKLAGEPSTPLPDPLIWLTWVAAATERLRLATGILLVPERNPLVLAKSTATLAQLSNGRFILGAGIGWLREEFDALGIPFAKRGARTDEYLKAMQLLWREDHASMHGEFVDFADVSSNPKPPGGAIPLVIGGHSDAAARRAGRFGAGLWPGRGSLERGRELLDLARSTASEHGHEPDSIELTFQHPEGLRDDPLAKVEELARMGVTRTIVPAFFLRKPDPMSAISQFGEGVIAATRNS